MRLNIFRYGRNLHCNLKVIMMVAGFSVLAPHLLQAQATKGKKISPDLFGLFFEDINRAADGGLYAELVQNRSFEYDPADNAAYTPLTGWAPKAGDPQVVDDGGRLNEHNRRYLRLPLPGGIINAGSNSGIKVEKAK